jgi:hypothetical protein
MCELQKSHTANYKYCEERIEYLKKMETVRNRNRKQSTQILSNINSFQNSPELYNLNFPTLQKSVSQKAPAHQLKLTTSIQSSVFKSKRI